MAKSDSITKLIKAGKFKEADRATLNALSDEAVVTIEKTFEEPAKDPLKDVTVEQFLDAAPDHLKSQLRRATQDELDAATKKGATGTTAPAVTANNSQTTAAPAKDFNAWLAEAPDQYREMVGEMAQNHAQMKEQLIVTITANKANQFSKEQLATFNVNQLRGIAAIAVSQQQTQSQQTQQQSPPSYFGAGGGWPVQNFAQQQAPQHPPAEEGLAVPTMNFDPKEHFARA